MAVLDSNNQRRARLTEQGRPLTAAKAHIEMMRPGLPQERRAALNQYIDQAQNAERLWQEWNAQLRTAFPNLSTAQAIPQTSYAQGIQTQMSMRVLEGMQSQTHMLEDVGLGTLNELRLDQITDTHQVYTAYNAMTEALRSARSDILDVELRRVDRARSSLLRLGERIRTENINMETFVQDAQRLLDEIPSVAGLDVSVPAWAQESPERMAQWIYSRVRDVGQTPEYQDLQALRRHMSSTLGEMDNVKLQALRDPHRVFEREALSLKTPREWNEINKQASPLFEYDYQLRSELEANRAAALPMGDARTALPIDASPTNLTRMATNYGGTEGFLVQAPEHVDSLIEHGIIPGSDRERYLASLEDLGQVEILRPRRERIPEGLHGRLERAMEQSADVYFPNNETPWTISAVDQATGTATLHKKAIDPGNVRVYVGQEHAQGVMDVYKARTQVHEQLAAVPDDIRGFLARKTSFGVREGQATRFVDSDVFLSGMYTTENMFDIQALFGPNMMQESQFHSKTAMEMLSRHAPWAIDLNNPDRMMEHLQNMETALWEYAAEDGRFRYLPGTPQAGLQGLLPANEDAVMGRFLEGAIRNEGITGQDVTARELMSLHHSRHGQMPVDEKSFLRTVHDFRRGVQAMEQAEMDTTRLGRYREFLDLSPEQQAQAYRSNMVALGGTWPADPTVLQEITPDLSLDDAFDLIERDDYQRYQQSLQTGDAALDAQSAHLYNVLDEVNLQDPQGVGGQQLRSTIRQMQETENLSAHQAFARMEQLHPDARQILHDVYGAEDLWQEYIGDGRWVPMGETSPEDMMDLLQDGTRGRNVRARAVIEGRELEGVLRQQTDGNMLLQTPSGVFAVGDSETLQMGLESLADTRAEFPLDLSRTEYAQGVVGQGEAIPFAQDLGLDPENLHRRSMWRRTDPGTDPGLTLRNLQALRDGAEGLVLDIETTGLPGDDVFDILSVSTQRVRLDEQGLVMDAIESQRVIMPEKDRRLLHSMIENARDSAEALAPKDRRLFANIAKFQDPSWGGFSDADLTSLDAEGLERLLRDTQEALPQFTRDGGAVSRRQAISRIARETQDRAVIGQNLSFDLGALRSTAEEVFAGPEGAVARSLRQNPSLVEAINTPELFDAVQQMSDAEFSPSAIHRFYSQVDQLQAEGVVSAADATNIRKVHGLGTVDPFHSMNPIEMEYLSEYVLPPGSRRNLGAAIAGTFPEGDPRRLRYEQGMHLDAVDVQATSDLLDEYTRRIPETPLQDVQLGQHVAVGREVGGGTVERGAYQIEQLRQTADGGYTLRLQNLLTAEQATVEAGTRSQMQHILGHNMAFLPSADDAVAYADFMTDDTLNRSMARAGVSADSFRYYRDMLDGSTPDLNQQARELLNQIDDGTLSPDQLTSGQRVALLNQANLTEQQLLNRQKLQMLAPTARQTAWHDAMRPVIGQAEDAMYPFLQGLENLEGAGLVEPSDAKQLARQFNEKVKSMGARKRNPFARSLGNLQGHDITVGTTTRAQAMGSLYGLRTSLLEGAEGLRPAEAERNILRHLNQGYREQLGPMRSLEEAASRIVNMRDQLPEAEMIDWTQTFTPERSQEIRTAGTQILRDHVRTAKSSWTDEQMAEARHQLRTIKDARRELGDPHGIRYTNINPQMEGDLVPLYSHRAADIGMAAPQDYMDEFRQIQRQLREVGLPDEAAGPLRSRQDEILRVLEDLTDPYSAQKVGPVAVDAQQMLGWAGDPRQHPFDALITRGEFQGQTLGDVLYDSQGNLNRRHAETLSQAAEQWGQQPRLAPLAARTQYAVQQAQSMPRATQDIAESIIRNVDPAAAPTPPTPSPTMVSRAGASGARELARQQTTQLKSSVLQTGRQTLQTGLDRYGLAVGGLALGAFALRNMTRRDMVVPDKQRAQDAQPRPIQQPVFEEQEVAMSHAPGVRIHVDATTDDTHADTKFAQLVKDSVNRALGVPVQVNAHIVDDREGINQQWIDSTVASLLQRG